ncbi:MAG: mechanosensitive ion channel domain-containing protein [Vicinamibacterales bacterium]
MSSQLAPRRRRDRLDALVMALLLVSIPVVPTLGSQPQTAPDEPVPAAVTPAPDADIEARLGEAYGALEDLTGVEAAVHGGVVRLRGTVDGPSASERAAAIAFAMPGVVYVDNQLDVRTQVGTRVSPLLARFRLWTQRLIAGLPLFALALAIVALFLLLARALARWSWPFERLVPNPLVRQLVQRLVAVTAFLVGVVLALELLDATTIVGAVLGTAGLAGIAVGFAFRDLVENYLAGLLLAFQQPFDVNDHVQVVGYEGRVIRMTSRETVLMTLDGNHLRVPNATVFKEILTNFTRNPLRRFEFPVSVGTAEQLTHVQRTGLDRLARVEGVVDTPPPFSRVEALGDSSVTVRYFGWVDQRGKDFAKVRSEAIRQVKAALDTAGVDMPAPIYTVAIAEPGQPPPFTAAPAPPTEEPPAHDVNVDHYLEQQIAADRRRDPEPDLLRP